MTNSRKISELLGKTTLTDSALITGVDVNGQNFKITFGDFKAQLGVTGTIQPVGVGVPILDQAGSDNNIRSLEAGAGVSISVGAQNDAKIDTDLLEGDSSGVQILKDRTTAPLIRSLKAGPGIDIAVADDAIQVSQGTGVTGNTVVVNALSDLPTAVGDVITLANDTSYVFSSSIDIGNLRFVLGNGVTIRSTGFSSVLLTSSTTGALFTSSSGGFNVFDTIRVDVPSGKVFDISSPTAKTGICLIQTLGVLNCVDLADFANLEFLLVGNTVTRNMTGRGPLFSGSFNVLNVDSAFSQTFTGTFVDLGTATFDIVNIENMTVISTNPSNKTFEGLPNSGNINAGGHGTVRAVSANGVFTPSTNILPSDIRWLFNDNYAIPDSRNAAQVVQTNNATITVISVAGTPVKLAGTWTEARASRFTTDATGRMTFIGETPETLTLTATLSTTKQGGGTDTYLFYAAKNGTVIAETASKMSSDSSRNVPVSVTGVIDFVNGDYIEMFVEGVGTTDNMLVDYANVLVID